LKKLEADFITFSGLSFYFINYFTRGKKVKIFVVSILGEGGRGPKLERRQ